MKNQFFYKRIEDGKTYLDHFNTDRIIRSMEMPDGTRLIVLDDFHERVEDIPQVNKHGIQVGKTRQRNTFQSQIILSKEDNENFVKTFQ